MATVTLLLSALVLHASYPTVRSYRRPDYTAGAQNWAVRQAPDGSMLFANGYGLLVFNSVYWQLYPVGNGTPVRSVLVDDDSRRVYAGASGEFGYFSSSGSGGVLQYHSLLPTVKGRNQQFNEIWNIMTTPRAKSHGVGDARYVWFQGDVKMFCYDGTSTLCIDTGKKITTSSMIDGWVYLAFADGNIGCIPPGDKPELKVMHTAGLPLADRICSILPAPRGTGAQLLVVTQFDGIYTFDGTSISPYLTALDNILKTSQVFCATISGDRLAVGTVSDGVAVLDLSTQQCTHLNITNGLQNNTVLSAYFDSSGNLWLALDNGIDYVLLNSPTYNLMGENGRFGAGYVSFFTGNTLLLGTNQGLFRTTYPTPSKGESEEVESLIHGQVWGIDTIGGTIFVSSDVGLYELQITNYELRKLCKVRKIEGIPAALSVSPVPGVPDMAMVSTYEKFHAIQRQPSGEWAEIGEISGYSDIGGHPKIDADGNIWFGHWIKGVYRLHFNPDRMIFDRIDLYDSSHGFPENNNIRVSTDDAGVIFSTSEGIYRYDASTDRMEPHPAYSSIPCRLPLSSVYATPWGQKWMVSSEDIRVLSQESPQSPVAVDTVSFRDLAPKLIPGYEHFNFMSPKSVIVAGLDGFYDVNPQYDIESACLAPAPGVEICSVYANADSTVYSASLFPDSLPADQVQLAHSLNNLTIEYVVPDFSRPTALRYRCMLRGYDREMSAYTTATKKEYTRLPPGQYTFVVEACNLHTGQISRCSLKIHILHPWYTSVWAIAVYVLLAATALWTAWKRLSLYMQRKALDQSRERERELEAMRIQAASEALSKDVEIERLRGEQLQHTIKHKSNELSNVTMNMMRKNEILLDISERLSRLNESLADSQDRAKVHRQIETIKKLIRENISHDDDWRSFARNFDIVYEKYLERLLQRFPSLSVREQQLCAYIRMGLSSKEIAPLMNISYRSVEMNRYRLRKKMGLEGDTALSDFLRNFPEESSPTP